MLIGHTTTTRRLLGGQLPLHLGLFLLACHLALAAPVRFDIPAQATDKALMDFGKQSGAQVLFSYHDAKGVRSPGIKGEFEPLDALRQLLVDTGFNATQQAPDKFLVAGPAGAKPGSIEGSIRDEMGKAVVGAKVALADSDQVVVTDKRGHFAIADVAAGSHALQITADGLQNTRVTEVEVKAGQSHSLSPVIIPVQKEGPLRLDDFVVSAKKNDGVVELDPYEVRDRKPAAFTTASLDLTRTENDALPFSTFSAADIQASGAGSLTEFLQHRLPQNFNPNITEELDGSGTSSTARVDQVDMRGWGAAETVFLLNGRKMAPEYQGFSGTSEDAVNATPNLRGIPLASIERIEILPSAGSAIYGANATGGVINIITRLDYSGGEFSGRYEQPGSGHASRRNYSFNYGRPLAAGFSLRLTANYDEYRPLLVGDRADQMLIRWRQLVMQREPSRLVPRRTDNTNVTNIAPVPFGATANIRALSSSVTANLFGAGTPNFTSVPAGYTGGGGLAAFAPTQGVFNFDLADGASGSSLYAKDSTLGVRSESQNYTVGIDRNFGAKWRWSADYRFAQADSYGRSDSGVLNFSSGSTFTDSTASRPRIPVGAPINPFTTTINVALIDPYMNLPELINRSRNRTETFSTALRGQIGEWLGYFDVSHTRSSNHMSDNNFYEPIGGWVNAFNTGAYNPFVDMRVVRPASAEFYRHYVRWRTLTHSEADSWTSSSRWSGPVWRLPSGPIQFTSGVEWTYFDRGSAGFETAYLDSVSLEPTVPFGGTLTTSRTNTSTNTQNQLRSFSSENYAGYGEINVPLAGEKREFAWAKSLELFASGRLDRLVNKGNLSTGTATDPTVPSRHSTNSRVGALGLRYDVIKGIGLRVSYSTGFHPPTLGQLSSIGTPTFSASFTDPKTNQAVTLPPSQFTYSGNPDLRPETTDSLNTGIIIQPGRLKNFRMSVDYVRSVRNDAITGLSFQQAVDLEDSGLDTVTRNPDGSIAFLDARNRNFAQISSRSVDFNIEYALENVVGGRVVFQTLATKNISFKVQTTPTTAAVEQIGNPTASFARMIRWNGNAHVRWEGRRWTYSWSVQYYDSILAKPSDYVLQGSDRAPWKLNHDLFVSFRSPPTGAAHGLKRLVAGSTVTLGVKNAFDRAPRFWAADSARGIAPYDSVMGRSIWLQVNKAL